MSTEAWNWKAFEPKQFDAVFDFDTKKTREVLLEGVDREQRESKREGESVKGTNKDIFI